MLSKRHSGLPQKAGMMGSGALASLTVAADDGQPNEKILITICEFTYWLVRCGLDDERNIGELHSLPKPSQPLHLIYSQHSELNR